MINQQGVQSIHLHVMACEDEEIRRMFVTFAEIQINAIYSSKFNRNTKRNYIIALELVAEKVKKLNITNITWGNFCLLMVNLYGLANEFKKPYKIFISEYFKYIITNTKQITEGIMELDKHILLLDVEERRVTTALCKDNIIMHRIITNFPIHSTFYQLQYVEGLGKRYNKGETSTIVNLNTTNGFIRNLLIGFINWINVESTSTPKILVLQFRIFIYYFEKSLIRPHTEIPKNIKEISLDTYKKQFEFYKSINNIYKMRFKIVDVLKQFYVFLMDFISVKGIEHNPFYGTNIDRDMLLKVNFNTWVDEEYCFQEKTGFEEMPDGDKWLLSDDSKAAANKTPQGFDFTILKQNVFKNDLKKWVWNTIGISTACLRIYFGQICEFINLKHEFDLEYSKVVKLNSSNSNEIFSAEFILYFKSIIEKEYKNLGTRENVYKSIKSFLSYYEVKYNVLPQTLKLIPFISPIPEGGNPVETDDWNKLNKEFKIRKEKSIEDELFYIIYNIKSTTHLRLGGILNLERNCITEINNTDPNPTGVIQCYSKTSKGVLKKYTLSLAKIRLIERAIKISKDLADLASEPKKKYIFLKHDTSNKMTNSLNKHIVYRISGSDFNSIFKEVQLKIFGEVKYIPYNLRHMFKDKVWKEGTKRNISILELERMTDTKYYTDMKHYRSKEGLLFYVEAIAGTTISDIDIKGDYIEEDYKVDKICPVLGGIGGCNEDGCKPRPLEGAEKFEDVLAVEDLCLTCGNFKTCISRIPVFAKRIDEIDNQIEQVNNDYEREVLVVRKKVYSHFYMKLLEQEKG